MSPQSTPFWILAPEDLFRQLGTSDLGLTREEAQRRLARSGANVLRPRKRAGTVALFFGQFMTPIVLILLFAARLAFFLGQRTDALIILAIGSDTWATESTMPPRCMRLTSASRSIRRSTLPRRQPTSSSSRGTSTFSPRAFVKGG